MKSRFLLLAGVVVALCVSANRPAAACTGIRILPKDGGVIAARTLEFAADLRSDVIVVPRAKDYVGTAPGGQPGLRWKSRYGIVGDQRLRRPGHRRRAQRKGSVRRHVLLPRLLPSIRTVKGKTRPGGRPLGLPVTCWAPVPTWPRPSRPPVACGRGDGAREHGLFAPCHYIINDAGGHCVVLEYVDGALKVYENPLGRDDQFADLRLARDEPAQLCEPSVNNVPAVELAGIKFPGLGQGSGMLGLPGDFTPPSRFVRAVAFSQSALPVATAHEGVLQAFHILNQFDIPKGAARGVEDGKSRCRLHALDECLGPEEPVFLLPHLRQQPHPHGGPEEDGPRRQGDQVDLDGRRGRNRGPVGGGEVGRAVRSPSGSDH